jgi:hypothetical protein
MTREEFMKQAIASGKPKDEIRTVFERMEADGAFTDTQPIQQPQPQQTQETSLGQDIMGSLQSTNEAMFKKIRRVDKPTVLGTMTRKNIPGVAGEMAGQWADIPEKAVRTVGSGLGIAGEMAAIPFNVAGAAINKATGGRAGKMLQMAVNKVADTKVAKNLIGWYSGLSEAEKANYSTAADLLEAFSFSGGKAAGKVAGKVVHKTGDITEGLGKKSLRSGMKIKDPTAKLAGINTEAGVQKIVNDVAKFKIESKTGGFKGMVNNAQKQIDTRMKKSAQAITNFTKKDPIAGVNVTDALKELEDDIRNGRVASIFTGEDNAADFVKEINKSLTKRNLHGYQLIKTLPEINKKMRQGMDLFSKGKFGINDAPMKELVGDLAYLKLLDKIGDRLPEVRKAGQEIHDLINVKTAALEATKRVGNRNDISLSEVLLLLGGGPALQSMGVPTNASFIVPAVAAGIVTKKALGSGRGASTLITAGRGLKSASDATKTILPKVGATTGAASIPIIQGKLKSPYDKR